MQQDKFFQAIYHINKTHYVEQIDEPPNPKLITKICLNYKQLNILPKWIKKCINLEELQCKNNKIKL